MIETKIKLINELPIIPGVALKVMNIASEGVDVSFSELEDIIKVDPGLTAKILQIANSALYARPREITNLQKAITLMGFKKIKSLVLLLTASSIFKKAKQTKFYKLFWQHSIITAFIAKKLAITAGKNDIAEHIFFCGLLHKIGKILIYDSDPAGYVKLIAREKEKDNWIEYFEEQFYGTNHKLLGAELFRKWNFPDMFIDAAAQHNSPYITSPYNTIIIFITVSSLMTEKIGFGNFTTPKKMLLEKMILQLSLNAKDIQYYETNYAGILSKDKLFRECSNLVGVNS